MATATTTPASSFRSASVGICIPAEFPEAEIRTALEGAGHTTEFWLEDPAAALEACLEGEVDVLLLGTPRPDTQLLKSVSELGRDGSEPKVVLICARSGNGEIRKALDAGISGLVALSELRTALSPVIDVVRAGQVSVPGSRGKELQKQILTSREKQILGLVVMGMTNAEIASKLFLAESTVKSHLSSAFAKLGVSSRSEAASLILDPHSGAGLGILTIPTG
jgi:two-component system response regulator DesR